MDFVLTKEQQRLVHNAAEVARDCLEPRAAAYDKSASHPRKSWRDLWERGFLGIAVPKEYGGLGLDILTYIMVIENLAYGCASSAMTLHMHSVVQRYIDQLASPGQKAMYYPDVIEGGKMFGSWGSEPQRRGGRAELETVVSPTHGGYAVNGDKHFCTMAGAAHRYMVHCDYRDDRGSQGKQLVLVPHDASGIAIGSDWDTLGMRATVSPSVTFEDCHVTEQELLGQPGDADEVDAGSVFGLGYAAVYIGAAQRALDFAVSFCKTHTFPPDEAPLSHDQIVQRHVAEMEMALEGARLVLYHTASRWNDADVEGRVVLRCRAKYVASQAALLVTSRAHQTVGGRSAHKRYPVERIYRDIRTATLMPPNEDRSLEAVGRATLGVEQDA